jgi:S-layer domain protein
MEENGGIWTKVFESKDAVETADLRYVRVPGASFRGKSHVQFRWIYKADWEKGAAIDNITVGLASKAVMVYTAGDKVRVTTDPNNPSASTKECTIETVPGTLGSEVTAVPGEGYEFDKWDDMRGEASRRDDRNGRFRAFFKKKREMYTLIYRSDANGDIQGRSYQLNVFAGDDGDPVEAVGKEGYHFERWSDGREDNPRVDRSVSAAIDVSANYAINEYVLTYETAGDGRIVGDSKQKVRHGGDGSAVTAEANAGYRFVKWSDGRIENPRQDKDVKSDVKVRTEFEKEKVIAVEAIFTVKDARGAVQGALVTIEGNSLETDAEGKVEIGGLKRQAYGYAITKRGYDEAKGTIDLTAGDKEETVMLKESAPLTAKVVFVVMDTRGAVVDTEMTVGSKSGRTGDDGKAEAQGLEKKVYDYAVTRNGYEPKRECGFARWR